jgi:hypothetical protein
MQPFNRASIFFQVKIAFSADVSPKRNRLISATVILGIKPFEMGLLLERRQKPEPVEPCESQR